MVGLKSLESENIEEAKWKQKDDRGICSWEEVLNSCKSGSEAPEDLAISTLYNKLHEAGPSYATPE